jgi:hypothetical protein
LRSQGAKQGNTVNLMNVMMELRKCCNHPYLVNGVEDKATAGIARHDAEELTRVLVDASGKLVLMDKLLPKLQAGGHKVLVFSQMVRCLDILEDYLKQRRYLYERLDGNVRGNDRQSAIDRFSKKGSDRFVFLLCTRAGGLGINLTAADTVIIYDSDWNPQNDIQAQARCHRIGQTQAVKVYRLITRNTYEMEMFRKVREQPCGTCVWAYERVGVCMRGASRLRVCARARVCRPLCRQRTTVSPDPPSARLIAGLAQARARPCGARRHRARRRAGGGRPGRRGRRARRQALCKGGSHCANGGLSRSRSCAPSLSPSASHALAVSRSLCAFLLVSRSRSLALSCACATPCAVAGDRLAA